MRRLKRTPPSNATGTVDRDGLERFLATHPPATLVPLADRLLIAAVDRHREEGPALAAQALPHLVTAAGQPEAAGQLTTLCVCTACIDDLGTDASDLRFPLALIARAVDVGAFEEPFRSTARYWLWRASLAKSYEDPGDVDLDNPAMAFMLATHRILCAANYGASPIPVGDLGSLQTVFAAALTPADPDDGDMVALALLCAACVVPPPPTEALRRRLGELQVKNGSLKTRRDDPVARHHAVCVAALALALLDDER